MAISLLKKNEGIKLTKNDEGLKQIKLGLGWDESKGYIEIPREVKETTGGFLGFGSKITTKIVMERKSIGAIDLDATILAFKNGRFITECSYRNKTVINNGKTLIKHSGDDTTGGSNRKGDDETINVFLSKIEDYADTLYLVLNIFGAKGKGQTLDMVQNAYVKVYCEDNDELAYFNLTENYKGKTGSVVGKAIKNSNEWEFVALGDGVDVRDIDELKKISSTY
jgi:tellurium resistance protein TerD